jgi:hypothetical protein
LGGEDLVGSVLCFARHGGAFRFWFVVGSCLTMM